LPSQNKLKFSKASPKQAEIAGHLVRSLFSGLNGLKGQDFVFENIW
jgi:hypothetical protein